MTSATERFVPAPSPSRAPSSSCAFTGVWLSPNEDVEWSWCYTPEGSYICGYSIISKYIS